ncbi:putative fatty acyl-CoA reductase CG5065 isoform X1 [Schistocerca piceifrons]|uniref:putative fatty acyl-CoA reductase CG5065 isoform X1 n=2 Tax=Schistocerca piceifrons TaxID=274613 RepID=UPI001F5F815B|nr:putative fatty acyl-CoA reductase CG5065 isoform X1 [Schistocerca piceifrons]
MTRHGVPLESTSGLSDSSPVTVKMTIINDGDTEAQVPQMEAVRDSSSEQQVHRLAVIGCEEPRLQKGTPVQRFFSGRCVLVTGATGFVGKVLLEKLLRSCPDVDTVYALVRPKKGFSVQQRIQHILSKPVFSNIGKEQRGRLVAVAGDVAQSGLGLSPDDAAMLRHRVSVIFHVAATVRLDEELQVAAAINVRGTWEVLRLARDMPNLKAVVHTSTAYVQCVRRQVRECVFEPPMTAAALLQLCDNLREDTGDLRRFLGSYPNTYTFTKAVAEHLIQQEFSDLPVAIVRPSIVVATMAEPFPGWVDSLNGPMAVVALGCSGLLRIFYCDVRKLMNLVPCDMVASCMVAAAWDVATNSRECTGRPKVYNCVTSSDAPLTYGDFVSSIGRCAAVWPPKAAVWCCSLWVTRHRPVYLLCRLLLQLLPAYVIDYVALLAHRKLRLRENYRKVHNFNMTVEFFVMREWDFETAQTEALRSRLAAEDRALLPFDPRLIDWESYFDHFVCGVRRFLLKDDLDSVPAARLRYRRLLRLHQSVKVAALLIVLAVACAIIYAVVYCFM